MNEAVISGVQQVFGQYAVKVNGKVVLFDNYDEAATQAVLEASSKEFLSKAVAFTNANNVDGKQAKQKQNVIVAYLAWEATSKDVTEDVTEA